MKYLPTILLGLFLTSLFLTSCGGSGYNPRPQNFSSNEESYEEEEEQPKKKKKKKSKKQVEEEEESNSYKKSNANGIQLEKIIGKWGDKYFTGDCWTFKENGIFIYEETDIPDEEDFLAQGDYQLKGNRIIFKSKSNDGYRQDGELEIVSIEENKIEILHYDERNYSFKKTLIRKY
jgi:hypothetical protein